MARPKYTITDTDLPHARSYIHSLLQRPGTHDIEITGEIREEFWTALDYRKKAATQAKELNAWCERHLAKADWQKLKVSIRKKRERRRTEKKTITISVAAFEKLKLLATRDGVTYSEYLEALLDRPRRLGHSIKAGRRKR